MSATAPGAKREAPAAVLGAGSWGTALAIQLARSGRPTHLWGRDSRRQDAMAAARSNERYLAGAPFPESLIVERDLASALRDVSDVLIAVPSHAFRRLL